MIYAYFTRNYFNFLMQEIYIYILVKSKVLLEWFYIWKLTLKLTMSLKYDSGVTSILVNIKLTNESMGKFSARQLIEESVTKA